METGPGDDAAILKIGDTRQALTVDHLRAFWTDPWVFGRIAAIHALGDVWAMGAAPQAALAQITLPRLSPVLQERTLSEIMAAASEIFRDEGAEIVGGHSTQGAELTVGFTVTGLARAPITLSGAEPGDRLILTRPIGSGTLFAAEMAGRARGDDIEAVLRTLSSTQGDAARILAPHARAMTDVTGFGLAGHAARMADASGLTAEIDLDALPVFDGAEALAEAGTRSTIWQANRDAVRFDGLETPRSTLLFDPQTAGGFLAAVPADAKAQVLTELTALGHCAADIGTLTDRGEAQVVAR